MKQLKSKTIISLQAAVLLYSCSSIMSKIASRFLNTEGVFSLRTIFSVGSIGLILFLYAIVWQQILKKVDLSFAYINKATLLFWSLIWSIFIFKETISVFNVIGVIIVFIGILIIGEANE